MRSTDEVHWCPDNTDIDTPSYAMLVLLRNAPTPALVDAVQTYVRHCSPQDFDIRDVLEETRSWGRWLDGELGFE